MAHFFNIKIAATLHLLSIFLPCSALIIGSDTTVSRETAATFPAADTNNTILGFASMDHGFKFENSSTTCTFNDFFPVSSIVNIRGGKLVLARDLTFDSNAYVIRGGRYEGNNYAIEFSAKDKSFALASSTGGCGQIVDLNEKFMSKPIQSVDWSLTTSFVAATCLNSLNALPELQLYLFNGTTLTPTTNGAIDLGLNGNDVRWHPRLDYLTLCKDYSVGSQEVQIYYRNISNGSFTVTGSADVAANAYATAWHPSGNYIAVGTADSLRELVLYSFSSGTITQRQIVNISPNTSIDSGCLCWSPGGNYLAIGTNSRSGGNPELMLYQFNGTTLTYTLGASIGSSIKALDWSPSGSYIAVGLASSLERLRLFKHKVWNGTLPEITTARIDQSSTVKSLQWARSGNCLLMGTSAGASSLLNAYSFNKTNETFSLFDSDPSTTSATNAIRFSRSNQYFVAGYDSGGVNVHSFQGVVIDDTPFLFDNTTLIFNSNVTINSLFWFKNNCRINGNGSTITFNTGSFVIRPEASLIIENSILIGIDSNKLRCMTDNGSLTLRNCVLSLANNYTFSRGALLFDKDSIVTGSNTFAYTTVRTSTIDSESTLFLDTGITFSYAPSRANRTLLYMNDVSSHLYLNGCTLFATRTGLDIARGTILLDNKITLSSQARYNAEGIIFKNDTTIKVLADAAINGYGCIIIE